MENDVLAKMMIGLAVVLAWAFVAGVEHAAAQPAPGHEYEEMTLPAGGVLRYAIVKPAGLDAGAGGADPQKSYPVLLALPPGNQDERMVEAGLAQYWEQEAQARGWVVVSPVEPGGQALFRDTEALFGALMDHVASQVNVEGGTFHVAGASNGGRLAFRVATLLPERVASVVVLPGYPPQRVDMERLEALAGKSVTMYVGEDDEQWMDESERTHKRLLELGAKAALHVLPGEGHVLHLDPATLFDALDAARTRQSPREVAVGATLDALHDAAKKAEFDRYFAQFADDAVFLGTDAGERWTVDQFKLYARPHFESGEGWAYAPVERHVSFSESGEVAWFDELLDGAKLGTCRGTGVLVLEDGVWKVAQYELSIAVPNEVADRVVRLIRANEER